MRKTFFLFLSPHKEAVFVNLTNFSRTAGAPVCYRFNDNRIDVQNWNSVMLPDLKINFKILKFKNMIKNNEKNIFS